MKESMTVKQIEKRLGHPLSLEGITDMNELLTLRRNAKALAEQFEESYMLAESNILWGFVDSINEYFRKLR